jgi:hypothetical protein
MADSYGTEWDDGCLGLTETLNREAEWRAQEAANDAVQWGVTDAVGGWEVTPPASPIGVVGIVEGVAWPDVSVDEHCGIWPSPSELVQAHCDAWLGFLSDAGWIEVTVEEYTSMGEFEGEHSTCRFL